MNTEDEEELGYESAPAELCNECTKTAPTDPKSWGLLGKPAERTSGSRIARLFQPKTTTCEWDSWKPARDVSND